MVAAAAAAADTVAAAVTHGASHFSNRRHCKCNGEREQLKRKRTMKSLGVAASRTLCSLALASICVWSYDVSPRFALGLLGQLREPDSYCLHESFNATCPQGDVVMMTSAIYGRMRLGRCINGDFNIGCSKDVITFFDSHCTARRHCDVSVRNLVDIHPCQRDFMSYLEASFVCVKVAAPTFASCATTRHVRVAADVSRGYLVYGQRPATSPDSVITTLRPLPSGHTSVAETGTKSCPWLVSARPGQRIRFSIVVVVDIDVPAGTASSDDVLPVPAGVICHETIVVDDSKIAENGAPPSAALIELPVCSGRLRERLIYMSVGNVVLLYVKDDSEESSHLVAPPAGRGEQTSIHQSTRFILTYESIGCPDLTAPPNAWMKRTGENVMIRCNDSLETWYMTCQGNRWIGDVTNCSLKVYPLVRDDDAKRQTIIPAQGLVMAVLLGIAFGIFIGLILLVALNCVRKRSPNFSGSKQRKAILMVPNGKPADEEDASGHPSTVTRLYQPSLYSSAHHASTLSISQPNGPLAAPGDLDPYCCPHYGYHAVSPSGNYFATFNCRPNADLWIPCDGTSLFSDRPTDVRFVTDGNGPGTPEGTSTRAFDESGKVFDGKFYPAALRTPEKALFQVRIAPETASCVGRTAGDFNSASSAELCLSCHSSDQLASC